MKIGDVVTVTDGSWCMHYSGSGELEHIYGIQLNARRWKVLAVDLVGPADRSNDEPDRPNNIMLCEVGCPEKILFVQSRFCVTVGVSRHHATARVTVPADTKELIVTFK